MTEEEWLSPVPDVPPTAAVELMTNVLLEGDCSERKLRLFAHAICKRVESLLADERSRTALNGLEMYADGRRGSEHLASSAALAQAAFDAISTSLGDPATQRADPRVHAAQAVRQATEAGEWFAAGAYAIAGIGAASWAAIVATGLRDAGHPGGDAEVEKAYQAEAEVQVRLLREVFGNPFRPLAFDPAWRTSDVMLLAKGIYEERAFERMPILADALQDAGCDSEDLLAHCRGPGPHVRGCWALDLVLDKE